MPLDIAPDDDSLAGLSRATVPSSTRADVVFGVDRVLGVGGMSVAFFALRAAPASWQAPFISIFADAGSVIAMTADGAILEGRDEKA